MFERIKANEQLSADLRPATKVFCASCGAHIAYLRDDSPTVFLLCGEPPDLSDMIPADGLRLPTGGACARCGRSFRAWFGEGGFKLKTDRGYLS